MRCRELVDLGGDEARAQPGKDEAVDRARVDVALDDHLAPALTERQAHGVVGVGRPVGQQPGSARAPRRRRELLGARERCRVGPRIDAVHERWDVHPQHLEADRVHEARGRLGPALVRRDVVAARVEVGVRFERCEIWRLALRRAHSAPHHSSAVSATTSVAASTSSTRTCSSEPWA